MLWHLAIGFGLLTACTYHPRYYYFFATKGGAQSMPITTPAPADAGIDAQNSR
jgi:hypothetical protein